MKNDFQDFDSSDGSSDAILCRTNVFVALRPSFQVCPDIDQHAKEEDIKESKGREASVC
jgi:hypothetical protein